jgi:hypothetical protein
MERGTMGNLSRFSKIAIVRKTVFWLVAAITFVILMGFIILLDKLIVEIIFSEFTYVWLIKPLVNLLTYQVWIIPYFPLIVLILLLVAYFIFCYVLYYKESERIGVNETRLSLTYNAFSGFKYANGKVKWIFHGIIYGIEILERTLKRDETKKFAQAIKEEGRNLTE